MMNDHERLLASARSAYASGNFDAAEQACRSVLASDPANEAAKYLSGMVAFRMGMVEEACGKLKEAIAAKGDDAEMLMHAAEVFRQAGKLIEAETAARKAVKLAPMAGPPLNNLGLVLQDGGKWKEAESAFVEAARVAPGYEKPHCNLGCLYLQQNRLPETIVALRKALKLKPDYPQAINALGETQRRMGSPEKAILHFEKALTLKSDYLPAMVNLGNSLSDLDRTAEANSAFERATAMNPKHAPAWHDWGNLCEKAGNWPKAAEFYEKAVELKPESLAYRIDRENARRYLCDWSGYADEVPRIVEACREPTARGEPAPMSPFMSLRFPTSAADQLAIAKQYSRHLARAVVQRSWRLCEGSFPVHPRLRIGFLSHQFNESVYGRLTQGLYERFHRRFFEIYAFDYSRPDDSACRRRIQAGCDRFIEVRGKSSLKIAEAIADAEIQILVDIDSYLAGGRPEIVAWRPALVQVSYLYPGTTGAEAFDYAIVDSVVAPPGSDADFTEKLIRIPAPYMVTTEVVESDIDRPADRSAWGLPADSFVYCSFNAADKIDPPTFDSWMRILTAVPHSVLWQLSDDSSVQTNLRREAGRRGVDPSRLVFAGRVAPAQHFERMRCGDLFLDTFNHGAHATAIDALHAGLPLLTCPGATMASRVSASLLTAAGLHELVSNDREEFEATAVKCGNNPSFIHGARQRLLDRNANVVPSEVQRLVHRLQVAFLEMWRFYTPGRLVPIVADPENPPA